MMSCGEQCGKLLSCGKHYCEQTCHRGDCDPCNEEVERRCYCTKTTRNIRCGEEQEKKVSSFLSHELSGYFACEEICGATLVSDIRCIFIWFKNKLFGGSVSSSGLF